MAASKSTGSFAKDVVSSIDIPKVDPLKVGGTGGGSLIGDLTGVAKFGLQLKAQDDAVEQKKRALVKQEKLSQVALDIQAFDVSTSGQVKDSQKLEFGRNQIMERAGLSALDKLTVLDKSAEISGKFVEEAQKAEIELAKATAEKNQSDSIKYTGENFDGSQVEAIKKGRIQDSKLRVAEQEHTTLMNQFAKDKGNREKKAAALESGASLIVNTIATEATRDLNIALNGFSKRGKLPKGTEGYLSPDDVKVQGIAWILRGREELVASFAEGTALLDPDMAQAAQGKLKEMLDTYDVIVAEWEGAVTGSRASDKAEQLAKQDIKDLTTRILSVPEVMGINAGISANVIDERSMKLVSDSFIKQLSIGAVAADKSLAIMQDFNKAKEVVGKTGAPPNSSPRDYLQKITDAAEDQNHTPEQITTAVELAAEIENSILNEIASGEVGDAGGVKQEWGAGDIIKRVRRIVSAPQKGDFSPGQVKLVTDSVMERWETLTPTQQATLTRELPAYVAQYMGDDTSGAFVPSVLAAYKKIVSIEGKPLYSIGIDPITKGFRVQISSDADILKQARLGESSGQFGLATLRPIEDRVRKMKTDLNLFARKVERMGVPNTLINSLAKATGVDKEVITEQILRGMANTSSLSVHPAFTVSQTAELKPLKGAPKTGTIGDVTGNVPTTLKSNPEAPKTGTIGDHLPDQDSLSSLDDETFEEFLKVDPRTQEIVDSLPVIPKFKWNSLPRETKQQVLSMSREQIRTAITLLAPE